MPNSRRKLSEQNKEIIKEISELPREHEEDSQMEYIRRETVFDGKESDDIKKQMDEEQVTAVEYFTNESAEMVV